MASWVPLARTDDLMEPYKCTTKIRTPLARRAPFRRNPLLWGSHEALTPTCQGRDLCKVLALLLHVFEDDHFLVSAFRMLISAFPNLNLCRLSNVLHGTLLILIAFFDLCDVLIDLILSILVGCVQSLFQFLGKLINGLDPSRVFAQTVLFHPGGEGPLRKSSKVLAPTAPSLYS